MITLLTNLRAFCVTALSLCLGLVMFGTGMPAQAQEVKSTAPDEQRRSGSEEARGQQQDSQTSTAAKDRPVIVNKRPFQDWLDSVRELKHQGQLDSDAYFNLVVTANRLSSGELINLKVESHEGAPQLLESARWLVGAFSESRIFSLFENVGRLVLQSRLGASAALFNASLEVDSPDEAGRIAIGYRALLDTGRMVKRGQTEGLIYGHTKVSANGKQIIFTITIPRQVLGELLNVKPSAP